jgi:hypothetical protein
MKKNLKTLSLILVAGSMLAAGGCRPLALYGVDPEGPAEYKLGWEDGCDTGLSAASSVFYKAMYGYKKRPELGGNQLYSQGWNEGFTYCRFHMDALGKDPDPGHGIFGVFY